MNFEELLRMAAKEELIGATVNAAAQYMAWHNDSTVDEAMQAYRHEVPADVLAIARLKLEQLVGAAS